jgi:ATP/maltotriose-dependent transcriptional regulator MalT
VAYCYLNLGTAGVLSGDLHEARRSYLDAYRAARRAGDQFIIANCLLGFALCLAAEGRDEQAAEVHGVADGLLHQQGSVLEVGEAKLREEDHARLRQRMGQAVFEERYRVGRARPGPEGIEQAVAGAEAEAALAP